MKDDDPMFDIKDSENVSLTNNEATSDKLLKASNVTNINADNNKAGLLKKNINNHKWHETSWGKIIIGVVIGIILLIIGLLLKNNAV